MWLCSLLKRSGAAVVWPFIGMSLPLVSHRGLRENENSQIRNPVQEGAVRFVVVLACRWLFSAAAAKLCRMGRAQDLRRCMPSWSNSFACYGCHGLLKFAAFLMAKCLVSGLMCRVSGGIRGLRDLPLVCFRCSRCPKLIRMVASKTPKAEPRCAPIA